MFENCRKLDMSKNSNDTKIVENHPNLDLCHKFLCAFVFENEGLTPEQKHYLVQNVANLAMTYDLEKALHVSEPKNGVFSIFFKSESGSNKINFDINDNWEG